MINLHIPNNPITHLYKTYTRSDETADYRIGYRDGSSVEVDALTWNEVRDLSQATWDAATASYWVAGVDTSDPMTDNPVDEADAFGARW